MSSMPMPTLLHPLRSRYRRPLATLALLLGMVAAAGAAIRTPIGPPEAPRPWRWYAATELPRVATAHIAPAALALGRDPYSLPPRESAILFVRQPDGRLDAWFLPVRGGLPRLPVDADWNPGLPCSRFDADFARGLIRCDDAALDPELRARYQWGLDGRRRNQLVPDLLRVPGTEEAGAFVLHKRAA